jgi:hypothetical protein
MFTAIMDDNTRFLYRAAEELRAMAMKTPEIAAELRRLADEITCEAAERERRSDPARPDPKTG